MSETKGKGYTGKISKAQIKKGTDHEMEHTSSRKVARKTAMDHFKDHGPKYYTVLEKAIKNNLPTYPYGGDLNLSAEQLAERHEDLKYLQYLDKPTPTAGQVAMNVGASLLPAVGGAFANGQGSIPNQFDVTQTGAGQGIQALGQQQMQGSVIQPQVLPTPQGGKYLYGGELMGLPEYGFGSWLGDNAGGILQGAGSAVSAIPIFGQIAGPILKGLGSITDGIVGGVRGKRAEAEAKIAEEREADAAILREQASGYAENFDPNKNINYGATFELGGDLMMEGSKNPVINTYDGNSNSHQQGVGGVPVDSKGNPSAVSKQSAVGLTEKGEVTWNGYVFSDKLNV